jgi:hypothetical protein
MIIISKKYDKIICLKNTFMLYLQKKKINL